MEYKRYDTFGTHRGWHVTYAVDEKGRYYLARVVAPQLDGAYIVFEYLP